MMKRTVLLAALVLTSSCIVFEGLDRVEYAEYTSSEAYRNEGQIVANLELGVGEMTLQRGSGDHLYELDLHYNKAAFRPELDYRSEDGTAHFEFQLESERGTSRSGKNQLNLHFNPQATLELQTSTGVGRSDIDLSGLKVISLQVEAGVGETKVSVLAPNPIRCRKARIASGVGALEAKGLGNLNFEKFEFEGGVGGAELDFSGAWENPGEVLIRVGVGGVDIRVPKELGVEISVSKSFLTGFDLPGFQKQGDLYRSRDFEKASKVLHLRIDAGIGGVSVSRI